eukprot:3166098-Ditylum_brightwellii.AAC.1
MQEVKDCELGLDGSYDISHISEGGNISSAFEYDLSNDERTFSEADDSFNHTSICPSEDAQETNVVGYTYGLRSLGRVMPEVRASV